VIVFSSVTFRLSVVPCCLCVCGVCVHMQFSVFSCNQHGDVSLVFVVAHRCTEGQW